MQKKNIQMSESLLVGSLLAVVGGFLESYSFLCRDRVFANCQTGNLVLLALNISSLNWMDALTYAIPIMAFIIGVILIDSLRFFSKSTYLHWRQPVILAEILLLLVTGFIPLGKGNMAATTLISFTCALQVETFRKVHGAVFATTMCTGNLRSGTFHLFHYFVTKDKTYASHAKHYYIVIGSFMIGAIVGGILTGILLGQAVWFTCFILFAVFWLMFL